MPSSSLRKGIGILGITGLIDYSLEFIKSIILAGYFGITGQVDAYLSGKSIPDLFITFTAGAAYGATLPNYPVHGAPEREKSKVMISALVTIGGFCLIAFSAGAILSDLVARVFFSGLKGQELAIASYTMAIMFIGGFFRIVVSILRSYYDHVYQFFIPAALDLLLSLLPIILVILLRDQLGVLSFPLGFLGASILISFFLFIGVARRFDIQWNFSFDFVAIRSILTLFPPLALGSLASRLNVVVDRIFASGLVVGSISSLQYGYYPLYIIHAVISVPITYALFPVISQKILNNDIEELRKLIRKVFRFFIVISIWGMWTLFFFRKEIIALLFGRGAFDSRAIEMTSIALLFYSLGFSVLSLNSLFLRVMMSSQDKRGLYSMGLLAVVVNLGGDWILGYYFKVAGIALTTSIVQITWAVVAYEFMRRKLGNFISRQDVFFLVNLVIISFIAVYPSNLVVRWLIYNYMGGWSLQFSYFVIILIGAASSVLIFSMILYFIRVPEVELLVKEVSFLRAQLIRKVLPGRQGLP